MLTVKEITAEELEEIMDQHPDILLPIEQTPQWHKYDEAFDNRSPVGTFSYSKDGKAVAVATIAYYSKKGRPSFVITRGPVWLVPNTARLEAQFVDTVEKQAREYSKPVLFVRTHLDFEQTKAVPTFEPAFYDRSIWVDLTPSEEDLMLSFSSTTRRYIRKAQKLGVEIHQIPAQDALKFFSTDLMPIMEETMQRNGFRGFDSEIYENMLEKLPDTAKLWVASYEGQPLCWLISTEYREEGIYYFGAGNDQARKLHAAFLLQYRAMLEAKKNGCKHWNMTGIVSDTFPGLEDVTEFKKRFSKDVKILPSMYDIPLSPLRYKAVTGLINARRNKFFTGAPGEEAKNNLYNVKKLSGEEFNKIVAEHPDTYFPLEQTPLWDNVDAKMQIPRTVQGLFGYYDGKKLIATARLVTFSSRIRSMTLINQGPVVFDTITQEQEEKLLDTIIDQCKGYSLFVRMQVRTNQAKAQPALEQFMYDRAIWLDLTPSEDELLASFSSTTRRRIRQAVKAGVEVKKIDPAQAPEVMEKEMLPILRETTARNDFTARSEDTYVAMLEGLDEKYVGLYVAYVEDRPVCWLMSTEFNGHAQYPYAAGNEEGRKTYASFLLQWDVIKEMKKRGNKVWDMTGIATDEFPQFKNVTQFKKGFSKNEAELPVHRDVPTSTVKYKAVAKGLEVKRSLRK
ncbi:MAG: peptidoglycan bridge formation glycyltransferase FemA/FemB family protein [Micrococcaceae bacterium]